MRRVMVRRLAVTRCIYNYTLCLWLVMASGCPDRPSDSATIEATTEGAGAGSSSTGVGVVTTSAMSTGSTGAPDGTTSTATSTGGSTTVDNSSGSSNDPTDPMCPSPMLHETAPWNSCDVFAQDCPPCQKCSAYANDGGGSWNDAKCVPVVEDPKQPGEPCMAQGGGVSGIDDCDKGAMCWDVDPEGNGICVALCTGNSDAPVCADPATACAVMNEGGVTNLCLLRCDPLASECPGDDLCTSVSGDDFLCVPDASGDSGQINTPCSFVNSCDAGLVCIDVSNAVECDQGEIGCCQPFCDLTVPDPDMQCAGAGQTCIAWYPEGEAPPGHEDVGVCGIKP